MDDKFFYQYAVKRAKKLVEENFPQLEIWQRLRLYVNRKVAREILEKTLAEANTN